MILFLITEALKASKYSECWLLVAGFWRLVSVL